MTNEERTALLAGPLMCRSCGHVTPHVEGWMLAAVLHHLVAVHGGNVNLLQYR